MLTCIAGYTGSMKGKQIKPKPVEGFTLDQLFDLVDKVQKKADGGDKSAQQVLETAWEKWSGSGGFAV